MPLHGYYFSDEALRWWANAFGCPGEVGNKAEYEIGDRRLGNNEDRSRRLDPDES